jgi:hypothetical protein
MQLQHQLRQAQTLRYYFHSLSCYCARVFSQGLIGGGDTIIIIRYSYYMFTYFQLQIKKLFSLQGAIPALIQLSSVTIHWYSLIVQWLFLFILFRWG